MSFTATDGSNLYAASKASVSFDAAKYYQSTVKMGKVVQVFNSGDPDIDDYLYSYSYKYVHIGLDQAYAIAKQLSAQNGGDPVAVVYDNVDSDVIYALSSDDSATKHQEDYDYLYAYTTNRVFLATLWEH